MKENKIIEGVDLFLVIALAAILIISSFINYPPLAALSIVLLILLVWRSVNRRKSRELEYFRGIEVLNENFDDVTRAAVFSMPFPLVMISPRGKIKWYNSQFSDCFEFGEPMINHQIDEVVDEFLMSKIVDDETQFIEMMIHERCYRFYLNFFKDIGEKKEEIYLLYGVDISKENDIRRRFVNEAYNAMHLQVDNYDEIFDATDEDMRPMVFAEIDRVISEYFHRYEAYIKKFDQDSYVITVTHGELVKIMADKFTVLDEVRDIELGNTLPPTLSIGVNTQGLNPLDLYRGALAAMDIAIGRGGDQVVVKDGELLHYFGGKNNALEKRNKVKARVISHALAQMIRQADQVFIMGHKNPDMDSFGSALGIYEACKMENRKGFIVLNEVVPSIRNIYEKVMDYDKDYEKVFIDSDEAVLKATPKSLVVIVDNHRRASLECADLLDITEHVVLIDHHRRGADYIDSATITYLETYVSSASEMVTELLFYMADDLKIPQVVAEALLAGISVDTKNFYYQTGVRTFEAASILKRQGADSIAVKNLFKDDESTVRSKSEVVSNAKIYRDNIAIGVFDEENEDSILVASVSADELMSILGIDASFVLTRSRGRIHISGRSLGKISVQLILEKIGGGGHLTSAGAQLDSTMEEAVETLKGAIDDFFKEEENESNTD